MLICNEIDLCKLPPPLLNCDSSNRMNIDADAHMYVPISICGKIVMFMVDTRSSSTILSKHMYDRLSCDYLVNSSGCNHGDCVSSTYTFFRQDKYWLPLLPVLFLTGVQESV